ncbi:MAG: hypothetical protein FRX48_06467 [Lasallia pustulata]|uniref:Uncharacterized protein n=1 Tax=Lasallia pustulata TaxID=136370 RepID=A0A5M8PLN4_9LECA|nr:MAG: hypothetical protein FRX48_06467 [Lasallia pustulata]
MTMASTDDPFPSSLPLPRFDSPRIFDSEMAGTMEDGGLEFFTSAMPQDSPGQLFAGDTLATSPYQSPMPVKSIRATSDAKRTVNGATFSASPDSSLQDSSSDSSVRPKRKVSSNSSHSAIPSRDVTMADGGHMNPWKDEDPMLGVVEPNVNFVASNLPAETNFELSNRAMENDFDFDSAASSPSPYATTLTSGHFAKNAARDFAVPYRTSPNQICKSKASSSSREASPLAMTTTIPGNKRHNLQHSNPAASSSGGDFINGALLNGFNQDPHWQQANGLCTKDPLQGFPIVQPTLGRPFASPAPPYGSKFGNYIAPSLTIHPTPLKSRVETQIPIKMTLFPMPPGATKLHLPTHTISKPKLLAKPMPLRSLDMLELYTMLVCTSAMQDNAKKQRAFARAAGFAPEPRKAESRRVSSGDIQSEDDDDNKPLNGGEVNICVGCITRERKRAARKKSKKPEEEEAWQQDEAKRIIVFNTQEVKEWQKPSTPSEALDPADPNYPGPISAAEMAPFPEGAMQVEVPMRIACYCRHQNEKLGFQVIFTIKDHENKLIAQAMTTPIIITDDHKTHATPASMPMQNPMYIENPPLPGAGVFAREPIQNYAPTPFRNAHSTTDLQGLQHSFNPLPMQQHPGQFTLMHDGSQNTSATLTPRNLSRQASPTVSAAPLHKKRKSSASGRVPDGLTMTRLQTSPDQTSPNAHPNWGSRNGSMSAGTSPYVTNYGSALPNERSYGGLPMPGQYNTGPSTPNSNENAFFSSAQRSQSLENLTGMQGMFSAPSSARQSRVPSPVIGPHSSGNPIGQSHPQPSVGSIYGIPTAMNPQRPPTIHKLIPGEGPKSGGIEVTCLGSGFCQGLEVMFGDCLATTTTYWSEASLVCLLPPALQVGTVAVTFKHNYQQNLQMQRYQSSPLPKQQVYFKYVDDDEQELLRHALAIVNRKMTGRFEDAGEIARRIVSAPASGSGSWAPSPSQGGDQHRQASNLSRAAMNSTDLENALLKCLELIDLDDSPFQARLNSRRTNGQGMLHMSASLGYNRLVAGLLARGANPDLRDRNGMTPMHMASLHGHLQIIRRLRLAGGDPNIRSLLGFTPADMASSQQVVGATRAIRHNSRSRSVGARGSLIRTGGSSATSLKSFWEPSSSDLSLYTDSSADESDEEDIDRRRRTGSSPTHAATPAEIWARSRRNSDALGPEHEQWYPEHLAKMAALLSPAAAMSAWRDQLAAQIQHFQQSVHWSLPNLQIPTLPPMPNLPSYQAYPVVQRISSLVPQRNPRPGPGSGYARDGKETDYRWWELLTGPASSPPAYEEIYPQKGAAATEVKKPSVVCAAADILLDRKYAATFDQAQVGDPVAISSIKLGKAARTRHQQEQLLAAHAKKVKKLRSDRNLFFIWIPLLALVVAAMLRTRLPQAWNGACEAFTYGQSRYQQCVVEAL